MSEPPPLRELPLFASVDEETLARLARDAKVESFESGGTVFRQGDPAATIAIVLQGYVKLMRIASCGDETLISICSRGQSLFEALTPDRAFYRLSAEAVGAAAVLKLPTAKLAHILRESPSLAFAMIDETAAKLNALIGEIESLKGQSADQRLARFILSLCPRGPDASSFRLPYDKRLIAARLGVTQETLSRAFGRLREIGVRTENRDVFVDSVKRLALECEDMEKYPRSPSQRRAQALEARRAAAE